MDKCTCSLPQLALAGWGLFLHKRKERTAPSRVESSCSLLVFVTVHCSVLAGHLFSYIYNAFTLSLLLYSRIAKTCTGQRNWFRNSSSRSAEAEKITHVEGPPDSSKSRAGGVVRRYESEALFASCSIS